MPRNIPTGKPADCVRAKAHMGSGGAYLTGLDAVTHKDLLLLVQDLLACAVIVCETGNTKPLRELMEGWDANLEILADKPLLKRLVKARQEVREGKGIPWEKVKRELGMGEDDAGMGAPDAEL